MLQSTSWRVHLFFYLKTVFSLGLDDQFFHWSAEESYVSYFLEEVWFSDISFISIKLSLSQFPAYHYSHISIHASILIVSKFDAFSYDQVSWFISQSLRFLFSGCTDFCYYTEMVLWKTFVLSSLHMHPNYYNWRHLKKYYPVSCQLKRKIHPDKEYKK